MGPGLSPGWVESFSTGTRIECVTLPGWLVGWWGGEGNGNSGSGNSGNNNHNSGNRGSGGSGGNGSGRSQGVEV